MRIGVATCGRPGRIGGDAAHCGAGKVGSLAGGDVGCGVAGSHSTGLPPHSEGRAMGRGVPWSSAVRRAFEGVPFVSIAGHGEWGGEREGPGVTNCA